MKSKKRSWIQHAIVFVLIIGMLLSMTSSVNVQAADLYLAYQTDENGTAVTKLKTAQREKYRVTKLYLEEGQNVDLCFINAVLWEKSQWYSSNPEVATVNSAGVITAVSAGVAEITLTYSRKITGTKISASAIVYVGEDNWDVQFLSLDAEEKDGYYEVKAGENIEFIFTGISKMDNPDIYSMSLESSDEEIGSVSLLTLTTKKPGIVTVTLNIKNKVTGNIIHKKTRVKSWLTVQEKMDYMLEQLGVEKNGKDVFFTVNQKKCTAHTDENNGCSNCSITEITQRSKDGWFNDIFGEVDVNCFPHHVWGDKYSGETDYRGKSCFGFTCFAQWYLYADYIDEKITATWGKPVPFTKANMKNLVKPGDVLRVNGHSVLVYSVEENYVMVIDSNWRKTGQSHCVVQMHELYYTHEKYAGYLTYIQRVTESDMAGAYGGKTTGITLSKPEVSEPSETTTLKYGILDLSSKGWTEYNVGLDKDMYADKAYTIRNGATFEILGKYKNSKGNTVYHVYLYDLKMKCYISAAYVKEVENLVVPTVTATPKPTATPTPSPTPQPDNRLYGTLDLSTTTWSSYNVGLDKDMNADKAYNIKNNAKLEILGEYTNTKGNKVYQVYSYDLKMECYINAKYVRVDYSNKELYGNLDLSAAGWSSYNAGTDKNMGADKAYTIPNGGKVKILAKHVSNKGNYIYEVYSYDLDMVCYVTAKYVRID